jgi:hypothetical protein
MGALVAFWCDATGRETEVVSRRIRRTVALDDDVVAAVEQLRRERSAGMSEVINELIRAGLLAKQPRQPFWRGSERLGIQIDVSDIADALERLEGPTAR